MSQIRINLLPHRQLKRAREQRLFSLFAALAVGAAVLVVVFVQSWISGVTDKQENRNAFLRSETAKLDAQIAEIAQLKQKTQDLIARKDAVENLQANRTEPVRLLTEMARLVPEGLYLKSLKQTNDEVTIVGYGQSEARAFSFMRVLAESPAFKSADLIQVVTTKVGALELKEFTLKAHTRNTVATPETQGPKKQEPGEK